MRGNATITFRKIGSAGFSLVELMIALGVVAFCLLPIFAMLPIGLTLNKNTINQTEAANLVTMVESDLRFAGIGKISRMLEVGIPATPITSGIVWKPLYFNEDAKPLLSAAGAKYQVTLTFGLASEKGPIPLNILVTWPAQVSSSKANGRFEAAVSLEQN